MAASRPEPDGFVVGNSLVDNHDHRLMHALLCAKIDSQIGLWPAWTLRKKLSIQ